MFLSFWGFFSPLSLGGIGCLMGIELGNSLPPGQLGSTNTSRLGSVNKFLLRAGLVKKNRVMQYVSKSFLFPSLYQKPEQIFL